MNRPLDPMQYPDLDVPMDVPQPVPVPADETTETGIVNEVSSAVSSAIDTTTRFLQDQGIKDMAEDVRQLINRHPVQALFVGLGIGFLIGRAMGPRI